MKHQIGGTGWQSGTVVTYLTFKVNRATENAGMEIWKMRYGQKCKGGKCRSGKCRSRQTVWKAESILYIERPLSYFLKIVLEILSE